MVRGAGPVSRGRRVTRSRAPGPQLTSGRSGWASALLPALAIPSRGSRATPVPSFPAPASTAEPPGPELSPSTLQSWRVAVRFQDFSFRQFQVDRSLGGKCREVSPIPSLSLTPQLPLLLTILTLGSSFLRVEDPILIHYYY